MIRKVYHQAQKWKMGSTKEIITCYLDTRYILTGAHKRLGLEKSTLDQGQGLKKGHTRSASMVRERDTRSATGTESRRIKL